ncbi:Hypothetical predicted protein, partial [Pelobates cultripes]
MARYRAREPLAGQNWPESGKRRVPMTTTGLIQIQVGRQARTPPTTPLMRKGTPTRRRGLTLRRYLRVRNK